ETPQEGFDIPNNSGGDGGESILAEERESESVNRTTADDVPKPNQESFEQAGEEEFLRGVDESFVEEEKTDDTCISTPNDQNRQNQSLQPEVEEIPGECMRILLKVNEDLGIPQSQIAESLGMKSGKKFQQARDLLVAKGLLAI